jgi:flavorubredoxin
MTAARGAIPQFPRTIAPGTYWFSTCLPFSADGREVHNHNSCFLVCGDRASMLVDTGLPFAWLELKEQLLTILDGRPLDYVFATHPEAPHMGNAGPLLELFPEAVLIGDLRNYQFYYPKLTHRFSPKAVGDVIDLGGRQLVMVPAVVHDLPNTLWAYETPHRILFVSDGYPYTHQHESDQCAMTSEELPAYPLAEDTGPVIEGALGWTRHVDAELVIRDVEALLERYPPAIIAPAHGGVVTNPVELTEVFKAGLRRISGAPLSGAPLA